MDEIEVKPHEQQGGGISITFAYQHAGKSMATESVSLTQDPQDTGAGTALQTSSFVAAAVASADEHDAPHDAEEGGQQPSQKSSRKLSMFHRAAKAKSTSIVRSHSTIRASRPSVKECLNDVPEEEMADLSLDVYNMFFLSELKSQAEFYSLACLIVKMSLYILITMDIAYNKEFPLETRRHAETAVVVAQLFLIPVAIVTQEELITSFFIFSHLKYSPEIKRRHPGATKWKYVVAHIARFCDGSMFLFINTVVMLLVIEDVLQLFLNFAALMFLQCIDNVALQVCLDGLWTRSLQEAAQDVVDMKFAYRHHWSHPCLQTSFVVIVWGTMLILWARVHYFWPTTAPRDGIDSYTFNVTVPP